MVLGTRPSSRRGVSVATTRALTSAGALLLRTRKENSVINLCGVAAGDADFRRFSPSLTS